MNETVLKAYGWENIKLAHDFYEVDYLSENDRVRYTISPDARKEVLKRLLKLNHETHEQEVKARPVHKRKKQKETKSRCIRTTNEVLLKTHINYKKINIYSSKGFKFDIRQKLFKS